MLHSPNDPADLTPEQRRREIAVILARGILRLQSTRQLAQESAPCGPPDDAPDPLQKGLEVSATSRPHVTGG
jgi:hypothetical protein